MTSKIVVNNIEADAGVSTVTFNSNVERGSSNLHSTGLALGAGSTVGAVTGVTTYYGDGSQLTGIDASSLKNGSDIKAQATASGVTVTGNLGVGGAATGVSNYSTLHLKGPSSGNGGAIRLQDYGDTADSDDFTIYKNSSAGYLRINGTDPLIAYLNGAERLKISSDGYVTKPNTPAFHVSRQGGDVSSNSYVVFDHSDYNNGSHYNTSDGKFTAPVTGIYFFSAWHFTGGTSAFYLRINGTTFGEYTWDDTGGCGTWVCPMTANQYAQIYTKYTWRGTSDYHNAFCGYLIG